MRTLALLAAQVMQSDAARSDRRLCAASTTCATERDSPRSVRSATADGLRPGCARRSGQALDPGTPTIVVRGGYTWTDGEKDAVLLEAPSSRHPGVSCPWPASDPSVSTSGRRRRSSPRESAVDSRSSSRSERRRPTCLRWWRVDDSGRLVVGEAAEGLPLDRVKRSVKRCITRNEQETTLDDGTTMKVDDAIAALLAQVATNARSGGIDLTEETTRLGCPAMWTGEQRQRLLGLAGTGWAARQRPHPDRRAGRRGRGMGDQAAGQPQDGLGRDAARLRHGRRHAGRRPARRPRRAGPGPGDLGALLVGHRRGRRRA